MAQFIGSSASLRDAEYHDIRSKTSQDAFKYVNTQFRPNTCPEALPYMCSFNEGYTSVSANKVRVGEGLTRVRGAPRPSTQLVGPSGHQHGNGDIEHTDTNTRLRTGHQEILRGSVRPHVQLQGPTPYQSGQRPWTAFDTTVVKGRGKYEYSVQDTSDYILKYPVEQCSNGIEPFLRGGASTRLCMDIVGSSDTL